MDQTASRTKDRMPNEPVTGDAAAALSGQYSPRDLESPFDLGATHMLVAALLGKQIFFVGGAEKSGTSWLQRLLDQHPEVSCIGEAHFLESLFPNIKSALEAHNRVMLDPKENAVLHELGETHPIFDYNDLQYVTASAVAMLLLKRSGGKPLRAIGERSAKNAYAFGMMARWFPGAKCIHIVRDPRDAGVSRWFHARRTVPSGQRDLMVSTCDFVRENTDAWIEVVGRGVRFGEGHPERYFELRYEDLVERTPSVLAGAFRFLGVDDSVETAEQCASCASFEKLSGGRARGQENPDSFFRKGVIGDWKNHLDAETHCYVIAKAGPLMRRFGYL